MGIAVAPHAEREIVGLQPTDHELVASVRTGDDRAFEQLFARYQRRIAAYVLGMVHDHGRAEDITQEIFISALRRMRETERPIAFKPWIYEIAKNACIDQFRRTRRTEEVSYDAEEGLGAADYGRLAQRGPSPDAQVDQKQALHDLCGAFGGLSETHHQILVLRELEGLSYREIGDRLDMSRPAVESTLFRARRRLTEEYDELVSGQRCLRVQALIGTAAEGLLGARDARRLARHLSHCQPCRRQARAAGVDAAAMARRPRRREAVAARIAGLLPFPAFLRGRRDPESVLGSSAAHHSHTVMTALGAMPEPVVAGWGKAAAAAATLVIAGLGAGVGVQAVQKPGDRADRPSPQMPRPATTSPNTVDRNSKRSAPGVPLAGQVRAGRGGLHAGGGPAPSSAAAPDKRPSNAGTKPVAGDPAGNGGQPPAGGDLAPASPVPAPEAPPTVAQPEPVVLPATDGSGKDGAPGKETPALGVPLGSTGDEPKGETAPPSGELDPAKVVGGLQSAGAAVGAGEGASGTGSGG